MSYFAAMQSAWELALDEWPFVFFFKLITGVLPIVIPAPRHDEVATQLKGSDDKYRQLV